MQAVSDPTGLTPAQKLVAQRLLEEQAARTIASNKRTFLSQSKPSTPDSENFRKDMNRAFAAKNQMFTNIDENGNISQKYADYSMTGKVRPGSQAAKAQEGVDRFNKAAAIVGAAEFGFALPSIIRGLTVTPELIPLALTEEETFAAEHLPYSDMSPAQYRRAMAEGKTGTIPWGPAEQAAQMAKESRGYKSFLNPMQEENKQAIFDLLQNDYLTGQEAERELGVYGSNIIGSNAYSPLRELPTEKQFLDFSWVDSELEKGNWRKLGDEFGRAMENNYGLDPKSEEQVRRFIDIWKQNQKKWFMDKYLSKKPDVQTIFGNISQNKTGGPGGIDLGLEPMQSRKSPYLQPYAYYERPNQFVNVLGGGLQGEVPIDKKFTVIGGAEMTNIDIPTIGFNEWRKPRYNVGVRYSFETGGKLPKYQTGTVGEDIKAKASRVKKKEEIPSTAKVVGTVGNDTYYEDPSTGKSYKTSPAPAPSTYAPQDPNVFIPKLVTHSWEDLIKKDSRGRSIIKDTPENKKIYEAARAKKYPADPSKYFVYGEETKPGTTTTEGDGSSTTTTTTEQSGFDKSSTTGENRFYEPLRWYDVAGNINAYLSALDLAPVPLEQLDREKLRVHELNPLPSLQQAQSDYNAGIRMLPTSGVGFSNMANLGAGKYAFGDKVLGEYENVNKGKKDVVDQLNEKNKYELDTANFAIRDQFNTRVAQRNEIQRQSKLNALDDLFTKVAQNRKLNREGNLVLELTPYFNQYGQFNGKQYKMIITGNNVDIIDRNTGRKVKTVKKDDLDESGNLKKTTVTKTTTD